MLIFIYCYDDGCYTKCQYTECRYAECQYAECRYAEYHGAIKTDQFLSLMQFKFVFWHKIILGYYLRHDYFKVNVLFIDLPLNSRQPNMSAYHIIQGNCALCLVLIKPCRGQH
jgi:hypothetical protein